MPITPVVGSFSTILFGESEFVFANSNTGSFYAVVEAPVSETLTPCCVASLHSVSCSAVSALVSSWPVVSLQFSILYSLMSWLPVDNFSDIISAFSAYYTYALEDV